MELTESTDLRHLIFALLFYTSFGTFLSFVVIRQSQVGRRYFVYHGLGLTALTLLALSILGTRRLAPPFQLSLLFFSLSTALFSVTAVRWPRWSYFFWLAGATTGIWALELDVTALQGFSYPLVINSFLSATLLGFSLSTLCLGHWYLVQPKLSISELSRLTTALIVLILARLFFSSYGIYGTLAPLTEIEVYRHLFSSTTGLFSVMRWTWGLLVPLGLSVLIWKTVRIRSTQSATGILYVAVLCVITGETISLYLTFFHSLPV